MKRILGMIACFMLVMFIAVGSRSEPSSGHFESQLGGTHESGDFEQVDSSQDDSAIGARAWLDEELLQAIRDAGPDNVMVAHDGETGETWVIEMDTSTPVPKRTEPRIPEGCEVADPPVLPHEIIGDRDDRAQITRPSVNAYPYCTMAYLEITYESGDFGTATGTFVDDTIILTSGHVIYHDEFGWADSVRVFPGGLLSDFPSTRSSTVRASSRWVDYGNRGDDYGAVIINRSLDTGYLGMNTATTSELKNASLIGVYGYPDDKDDGTLWYSSGNLSNPLSKTFLHTADTTGGNSGGPVVDMSDFNNIIGVHSGYEGSPTRKNIAARMTDSMVRFVQQCADLR